MASEVLLLASFPPCAISVTYRVISLTDNLEFVALDIRLLFFEQGISQPQPVKGRQVAYGPRGGRLHLQMPRSVPLLLQIAVGKIDRPHSRHAYTRKEKVHQKETCVQDIFTLLTKKARQPRPPSRVRG
ncbi:hypothetical protein F5Y19DRAFT_456250 [Xylariaceae sp. FL1651]|nr:hypothetical protein F5Y19DRAFT_456250 [Xylariaceae sp. FL1651]